MALLRGRASFGGRMRALRIAKGLSQVDLARLIGRHQTVIGPYERDEYAPPREIVERLAGALDTSPEYLFFGRSPRRSTIEVVGDIGPLGLLLQADAEPVGEPFLLKDEWLAAFRVLDDSMAPSYRVSQLVLIPRVAQGDVDSFLGRDVLAELGDGRTLLRRLVPAAEPRRFDLSAYNAPPLSGVMVQRARPVLGALWPEALSRRLSD